ncbi:MAG: hypothetical protein IPK17_38535 [Chloroflexi bacterium]|uniref:hypothetical protein n=1 Tax=Candidatus Flexifilum breve TaxID=3140694 RepID=UPI003136DBC7|nr:hypothetical protein [Chloroflexota bacterium]
MPITLDGVALANASAPILFQTCRFPIMDLRRYRQPDEVVQNMPTFVGNWADGTIAPAIDSQVINVDTTTNAADACRFPIVSVALGGCNWIAPYMKVIGLESEQINWAQLVTAYCTVANLQLDRLGQIFNADGTLVAGNPYTLNIVRFATALLRETLGLTFTHSALLGDYSNVNQFDGLYNQIDNGWVNGSDACDSTLNAGNAVNWDTLTGGDGSGTASPDDVTVATTVTLWGQSFDVPAGWTLADFLAMYAEAAQANYGRGQQVAWEMHAPSGWRMAVLKALSCIQLCNASTFMSDDLIARYERLVSGKIAELFGYGLTFPVLETAYTGANTLRFGPRELGGVPTYGLVLDNIVNVLRALNPLGQALYGSGQGRMPGDTEPLLGMTREKIVNRFEASTIHWDFSKVSPICVRASIMLKAGMLATDRHLWLKITNVGVNNLRLTSPSDWTVNSVAVNDTALGAPTQSSPANNASTTDTTPDLVWGAVTGAISYDVQVSTNVGMTEVVREANQTGTTYTPAALALDDYWWRVRAVDIDGPGAWSTVRKFTVAAP